MPEEDIRAARTNSNHRLIDLLLLSDRGEVVAMGHVSIRDLAVALNQGFIQYMLARVTNPAEGIYTMVVAGWHDPEASAELIDEVADDPAVVGVVAVTAGSRLPFGDAVYDRIFAAAERHGLPMVFPGAPGLNHVEGADYAQFERLIESHSLGFMIANQIQLTSLILQGIPERFADLKFVFQESGLFGVPMMQYRLDEYFLKRRSEAPLLQGVPNEYIRDRTAGVRRAHRRLHRRCVSQGRALPPRSAATMSW